MKAFITSNGTRYEIDSASAICLTAVSKAVDKLNASIIEMHLSNQGEKEVCLEKLELELPLDLNGKEKQIYRIYKEGLTVVGVAASRGEGDCDFELDPNFTPFTVSDPSSYTWKSPNAFSSEQVAVLQNMDSGDNILAGFISADKFLCRILMEIKPARITASIDLEGYLLPPGNKLVLDPLMVAKDSDIEKLLVLHAEMLGKQMNFIKQPTISTGWCSYYYYYGQETEDDILENARFLADRRKSIPVQYIQIDDGWQKYRGEWTENHPSKFPHGMSWLAKEIVNLGFTPGIWLAPYLISPNASVYQKHPEWLLRKQNGDLVKMGEDFVLDITHPDAAAWLAECLKTIKSWGYKYFKLDFMMVETCAGVRYHSPAITRLQAYRQGLQLIRETLGDEIYILGGTGLLYPSIGLLDASRISTDVTPFWGKKDRTPESPAIPNVCRNIINRAYMHRRLWVNDPDCLIVREFHNRPKYSHIPSLTTQEIQILATAMIMSGGALFLGDRMKDLSEERLRIIQKVFELANGNAAYPLDRVEAEIPQLWFRKDNSPLLGIFNWSEAGVSINVSKNKLGFEETTALAYEDIWMNVNGIWDTDQNFLKIELAPHSCKLFKISCT